MEYYPHSFFFIYVEHTSGTHTLTLHCPKVCRLAIRNSNVVGKKDLLICKTRSEFCLDKCWHESIRQMAGL